MATLISRAQSVFKREIEADEITWRICRLTSLVDFILVGLTSFRSNPNKDNLIKLFNACLKALIVNDLGEVKIGEFDLSQVIQKISLERHDILTSYMMAVSEYQKKSMSNKTNLFSEENYLRVLSNLNSDYFPVDTIYSVMHLCTQQYKA